MACSTGMCNGGSCGGSCQDLCAAGVARCAPSGGKEVCRLSGSGCLDWVAQPCPSQQFCDQNQCVAAIPCDPACPSSYMCKLNGVCAGGSPTNLQLNVPTVQISGAVALNGAAPAAMTANCSATSRPTQVKATVFLTEKTRGYSYSVDLFCRDNNFNFAATIFPGTYTVAVRGTDPFYVNLPNQAFVTDTDLIVAADIKNKVLNVKTVQVSGSVTLNGAAPAAMTANCSATNRPTQVKATVSLTEKTQGYSFSVDLFCRDNNFNFASPIFPGTYDIAVRGTDPFFVNLPAQSYVTDGSLVIAADIAGKVLNVRTVNIDGTVTLNGVAPAAMTANCSATNRPTQVKATVALTEKVHGYSFSVDLFCRDNNFNFASPIFPGTYDVAVRGTDPFFVNLPPQAYVTDSALVVDANLAGKVLNVRTVQIDGSVTLNGAAPAAMTANCSATNRPTQVKAMVSLTEQTHGYSFSVNLFCRDNNFNFASTIFPGTYTLSVQGTDPFFVDLPSQSYVAESGLVVTANVTGKVLNVRTAQVAGAITLNGAPPMAVAANCSATNRPTQVKATVALTEKTRGYSFSVALFCRDADFSFAGTIFPGTYAVTVRGTDPFYGDLPNQEFVADRALVVATHVTGKVLNVATLQVGGTIKLNGVPAMAMLANCSATNRPTQVKARVLFTEQTYAYSFPIELFCRDASFNFAGTIFPGTYAVAVRGTDPFYVDLPNQDFIAISRIQLP